MNTASNQEKKEPRFLSRAKLALSILIASSVCVGILCTGEPRAQRAGNAGPRSVVMLAIALAAGVLSFVGAYQIANKARCRSLRRELSLVES